MFFLRVVCFVSFSSSNPAFVSLGGGTASGTKMLTAEGVVDRASVEAFHKAAVAAGGKCNGTPGVRAQYGPTYYAAFVIDPAGNNIEALCTAPV